MAIPRWLQVADSTASHYHLVSRCVRRAWLCGKDPVTRMNYNHRKQWLQQRIFHLAQYCALEVRAFSILSNHFHLVVYFDPLRCNEWSDVEVVRRWVAAFPPKGEGATLEVLIEAQKKHLLEDKELLEKRRQQLGTLSFFMKHLKQPIAYRANQEDGCKGHFFEQRFYSGALLTEKAVLACMAYVDLNPVRAKIATSLKQCVDSSIYMKLQHIENSLEKLQEFLEPVVSGLGEATCKLGVTLKEYISYLQVLVKVETEPAPLAQTQEHVWFTQVASFKRRQKAYGSLEALTSWCQKQGFKRTGPYLPE